MSRIATLALLAVAALGLAGCKKAIQAPVDTGICYHMAPQDDGTYKFNIVARNIKNIENCAAQLEGMRLRFLRMGGQTKELMGTYQGSFILVRRNGIYRAQKWEGTEYIMLLRTGDGRLVIPGAVQ